MNEDESTEGGDQESQDMEHIQAFVDGCDADELEYLKQAIETRESDMESDSSEPENETKTKPRKDLEYSIDDKF